MPSCSSQVPPPWQGFLEHGLVAGVVVVVVGEVVLRGEDRLVSGLHS